MDGGIPTGPHLFHLHSVDRSDGQTISFAHKSTTHSNRSGQGHHLDFQMVGTAGNPHTGFDPKVECHQVEIHFTAVDHVSAGRYTDGTSSRTDTSKGHISSRVIANVATSGRGYRPVTHRNGATLRLHVDGSHSTGAQITSRRLRHR